MADITGQDKTKIMRGQSLRVYIDPTVNADGTITLSVAGGLDTVVHASAKELGFTQDGAHLTVSRSFEDLPVDQRNNNILQSMTHQEPHLKVGGLQVRDWAVWQKLQPGAAVMTGTGFNGISDAVDQSFALHVVAAVAPTPNDPTKFQVLIVYACYNVAELALMLSKAYNKTPLDFKGQDAGRTDGKTWAAWETTV